MSEKIKILKIAARLYPPGNWPIIYSPVGGMSIQVRNLSMEMGKSGVSQTILTTNLPAYPKHKKHSNFLEIYSLGMRIPQCLVPILAGLLWFFPLVRHLIKYRKKYDLVHIHYNDWIACRLFSLLAQFLNTPVVVTLNAELLCKSRFQKYLCTPSFNLLHRIALEL